MEKLFCRFLTKIGMIDKDTSLKFMKIYNDIYNDNKSINIFELSFQILIAFFNNITSNQKNYMCHNLPLKFYEMHETNKKHKLISLLSKKRMKNKIKLSKYFFKWKNLSNNTKENNKLKKNYNSFNKKNSSNKRNSKNIINNINKMIYPKYSSKESILFDKSNSIEEEGFSLDKIYKSDSQLCLSNTKKCCKNPEKKIFNNFLNNIKYKEINKSTTENKILNSKKKRNFSHSINNINDIKGNKIKKEIRECTFKPKINNLKQSITTSKIYYQPKKEELQSRFDKLYYDNEKYKLSKEIKAIELDNMTNKELTFNPNINYAPNLLNDQKKVKFENRINNFLQLKNKHSDDMKNKMDKEFNRNHSFTPKINKSYSSNSFIPKTYNEKNEFDNFPVYIRLYEESKLRKRKNYERKKDIDDYITNLSNNLNKKISVDFKKINDLYKYKKKSEINEKTRNKVQKEEGITFKPFIYKNKFSKNIHSNFYKRNSKFIEDKEKFIFLNQNSISPKVKISNKEKKEIVKNIVDRLYNESKSRSKNNNECNKYIKSIQESFNNLKNYEYINYHNYNSIE